MSPAQTKQDLLADVLRLTELCGRQEKEIEALTGDLRIAQQAHKQMVSDLEWMRNAREILQAEQRQLRQEYVLALDQLDESQQSHAKTIADWAVLKLAHDKLRAEHEALVDSQ